MNEALKRIHLQVMWNRLIAVVEEQAQALLRTAFGAITREAGDLSAGVYDTRGNMLAQAVTGTPGHVNSMAAAVKHFFARFPIESMRAGDVFVTNDPWMGTGHLFDFVMVTPVFRGERPVALFASTCHTVDVGGVGFNAEARSVYEEGICIPHLRLRSRGELEEPVLAIIMANSRNPIEARGDLLSLVACNDVGAARLSDMMREFDLESIDELASHILETSRAATRAAIAKLPPGEYRCTTRLDGYESPIELRARMTIRDGELTVDYAGSSAVSARGINSPKCYTDAYSVFGLKCIIAPSIPNNAGSLEPFRVLAEENTCVHPLRPAPVTARHVIGQMLPDLMFGCLSQALEGRVPAESAGSIWVLPLASEGTSGTQFNVLNVGLGGTGARPGKDGLNTTAFPSGVGVVPVEITENQSPLVFWAKEYRPDSGGAGEFRGGLGQRIVIGNSEDAPFSIAAGTFDRLRNPAIGREGGRAGAPGAVRLASGKVLATKAVHVVPAGDRLVLELPGGGGMGEPKKRERAKLEVDLEAGLVTPEGTARDYQ
ncbi:MAG TPA: hydantoinase B/oxoprolinase family protein [Burkholderiales bacterium]|nr:hydantoinase B/oxoprolinase family protein [Burkholderiales bacterium]